jgi:hypothetical protein
MAISIGRRQFISALGGAAVVRPLAAHAQQPVMPVIGFLSSAAFNAYGEGVPAFCRGLNETGFIEGQNVAIEYRSAGDNTIGCRRWRPIWLAARFPSSLRQAASRPRSRPKQQPRLFR